MLNSCNIESGKIVIEEYVRKVLLGESFSRDDLGVFGKLTCLGLVYIPYISIRTLANPISNFNQQSISAKAGTQINVYQVRDLAGIPTLLSSSNYLFDQ